MVSFLVPIRDSDSIDHLMTLINMSDITNDMKVFNSNVIIESINFY